MVQMHAVKVRADYEIYKILQILQIQALLTQQFLSQPLQIKLQLQQQIQQQIQQQMHQILLKQFRLLIFLQPCLI